MQGWRCGMEDTHIADEVKLPDGSTGMLFGVFDGHGGQEVADFAKENFTKTFNQQVQKSTAGNYSQARIDTFMSVDTSVGSEAYAADTGSTACVVLITQKQIYCANAGDSRAVLSKKNETVALSEDHKPSNAGELARIEKANHHVEDDRVDGNLALSRAFGDYQYKDNRALNAQDQAVTAYPEVRCFERTRDDLFIINACDGIWDCLTNEAACKFFNEKLS